MTKCTMISHRSFLLIGLLICKGLGKTQNGFSEASDCPHNSTDFDPLPQDQFIAKLTDPCRYDKYERPDPTNPLNVNIEINLTHLLASQTQLTTYLLMHFKYADDRLNYEKLAPSRYGTKVIGDESLKNMIWTPNVFIRDDRNTTVVSIQEKDIFISIDQRGEVVYSYKMVVMFYCLLDLKKFPFDSQTCSLMLSDRSYGGDSLKWTVNDSNMHPGKLLFGEYVLDQSSVVESYDNESTGFNESSVYNELQITMKFHRDFGYYLFDFFLPSYLLVCTAWVTFWLQADAGPPRATLGASTVIAFVTLHLGVAKDIPKVSYIKASDVWFLGISCFIFFSLAEFAFVNVIWRRKKTVELKKEKNKYILKSAVMPSIARRDLKKYESTQTLWTPNSESLNSLNTQTLSNHDNQFNGMYRSSTDLGPDAKSNGHSIISIPEATSKQFNWPQMTPQEVAIWVDRKARLVFPLMFLIFNILYWTFVYVL